MRREHIVPGCDVGVSWQAVPVSNLVLIAGPETLLIDRAVDRVLRSAREEAYHPPRGYSALDHHLANFVESVRSGTQAFEDAAFGLRAAGPALLSNRSQRERRPVAWDPERMRAV